MAAVVLNARTAYYNFLLSAQLLIVGQDALRQTVIHLNQAQALFEAGKQAQIAVTKARVDVANAEVDLIKAKNTCSLAKVQMDVAAGIQLSEPLVLTDSLSGMEDSLSLSLTDAIKKAIEQSPEIGSSRKNMEAQRLLLKATQAAYLPSLNANGGLGWNAASSTSIEGSDFNGKPNWNIGASLSTPIFDGGAIRASVKKAEAAIGKAEAQLDALSQSTVQRVHQYFLQEKEAKQQMGATKTLIEQADEGLRMSQERFRAGLATSIEIMDAEVTLANAKKSNAQARYDYHVAHANLVSAMGSLNE